MTKKEKMKLLKKESPELLELIQDFKTKVKLRAASGPGLRRDWDGTETGHDLYVSATASRPQLTELKDELQPLVQMVKDGKIPEGKVGLTFLDVD